METPQRVKQFIFFTTRKNFLEISRGKSYKYCLSDIISLSRVNDFTLRKDASMSREYTIASVIKMRLVMADVRSLFFKLEN